MNLWDKRIGQLLLMAAVALFFFACEDETSLLGYKNPNTKFKVEFVDLPLTSSVMLLDSFSTSNIYYPAAPDFGRILVGQYTDPVFGEVRAQAYLEFRPTTLTFIPSGAVFDSANLHLRFDHYVYGATDLSMQSYAAYELSEGFVYGDQQNNYFNKSTLAHHPQPIGTNSFSISTLEFKDKYYATSGNNDTTTISFRLDPSFGQRLFDVASNASGDSIIYKVSRFREQFKGITIAPQSNSKKIVRFFPNSPLSRMRVYYHNGDTKSFVDFVFTSVTNYPAGHFSAITTDRSSSALSGLTTPFTDFYPQDDKRYIQAGGGIVTKIDISKFYEFAKADSNANIIFNAVEVRIDNIDAPGNYEPPYSLAALLLRPGNRFQYFKSKQDTTDFGAYRGLVNTYSSFGFAAIFDDANGRDQSRPFGTLVYSKDKNQYRGVATMFFQLLYNRRDEEGIVNQLVLYPHATRPLIPNEGTTRYEGGKSVHRVSFPKDNIKLRIFYTKPTLNTTP